MDSEGRVAGVTTGSAGLLGPRVCQQPHASTIRNALMAVITRPMKAISKVDIRAVSNPIAVLWPVPVRLTLIQLKPIRPLCPANGPGPPR